MPAGAVGELKESIERAAAAEASLDAMTKAVIGARQKGLAAAVAKRALQYWQAQRENQLVITLRDETAAMKEKVADLQAEIPALEASLKAIGEKKAAVPAPAAEELAKLEKQLATETARLDEARKELAALAPQVPEKEKAVEAGWQKYLGMLPK